jgi:hypothetical protein
MAKAEAKERSLQILEVPVPVVLQMVRVPSAPKAMFYVRC